MAKRATPLTQRSRRRIADIPEDSEIPTSEESRSIIEMAKKQVALSTSMGMLNILYFAFFEFLAASSAVSSSVASFPVPAATILSANCSSSPVVPAQIRSSSITPNVTGTQLYSSLFLTFLFSVSLFLHLPPLLFNSLLTLVHRAHCRQST